MDDTATAQHRNRIGISHHFAKLVGNDDDGALAAAGKLAYVTEHLIGLLRCQYRSRLVQYQQARLEVKLLEQFQLLLFPGGQLSWASVQIEAKRRGRQKRDEFRTLASPVNQQGHLVGCQQQVFGHGHTGGKGEMLVHHADAERAGNYRVDDVLLAPVDHDAAFFGTLKACDAFDQRTFTRAVFTEQRMHRARLDAQGDLLHRGEAAKTLGEAVGFQRQGTRRRLGGGN